MITTWVHHGVLCIILFILLSWLIGRQFHPGDPTTGTSCASTTDLSNHLPDHLIIPHSPSIIQNHHVNVVISCIYHTSCIDFWEVYTYVHSQFDLFSISITFFWSLQLIYYSFISFTSTQLLLSPYMVNALYWYMNICYYIVLILLYMHAGRSFIF